MMQVDLDDYAGKPNFKYCPIDNPEKPVLRMYGVTKEGSHVCFLQA